MAMDALSRDFDFSAAEAEFRAGVGSADAAPFYNGRKPERYADADVSSPVIDPMQAIRWPMVHTDAAFRVLTSARYRLLGRLAMRGGMPEVAEALRTFTAANRRLEDMTELADSLRGLIAGKLNDPGLHEDNGVIPISHLVLRYPIFSLEMTVDQINCFVLQANTATNQSFKSIFQLADITAGFERLVSITQPLFMTASIILGAINNNDIALVLHTINGMKYQDAYTDHEFTSSPWEVWRTALLWEKRVSDDGRRTGNSEIRLPHHLSTPGVHIMAGVPDGHLVWADGSFHARAMKEIPVAASQDIGTDSDTIKTKNKNTGDNAEARVSRNNLKPIEGRFGGNLSSLSISFDKVAIHSAAPVETRSMKRARESAERMIAPTGVETRSRKRSRLNEVVDVRDMEVGGGGRTTKKR